MTEPTEGLSLSDLGSATTLQAIAALLESGDHDHALRLLRQAQEAAISTPPVQEPAAVVEEAAFLADRLDEFERVLLDDEVAREFHGHVAPALARFRQALQQQEPRNDG